VIHNILNYGRIVGFIKNIQLKIGKKLPGYDIYRRLLNSFSRGEMNEF